MSITCIIKFIILQTAHSIFHISYHVVYITLSYSMRPWNHAHDIRTSQNEVSTNVTSNRGPPLLNTGYTKLFHMYFNLILSYTSVITSHTYDVVQDSHRVCCAMTKNNLESLLMSRSPFNYHILTPLVSFIQLCASFKAGLIHSLGILTLTDIDHVSILKSSVCPKPKRGEITGQSDPKHLSVYRGLNPVRSLYWQYRFNDQEI